MSSNFMDPGLPSDDQARVARNLEQIIHSNNYRLAHQDLDLLNSSSMRGVRMLLEISKPELYFAEAGITSTIIVFGGARLQEKSAASKPQRSDSGAGCRSRLNSMEAKGKPCQKDAGAVFVLRCSKGIRFFGLSFWSVRLKLRTLLFIPCDCDRRRTWNYGSG